MHSEFLGLSIKDYQHLDRCVAIRKASYEYFLPSLKNEDLLITTWLTASDGKFRLDRRFQMIKHATGQTVQRGHWELICVNLKSMTPLAAEKQPNSQRNLSNATAVQ